MDVRLKNTMLVCLLLAFSDGAAAQVFTPTRVPQTRVVEPPDDLVPVEVLDAAETCIVRDTQQSRRILEALKTRASAIRRIYGQAYERVQPPPVRGSAIYEGRRRLDKLSNDIQDAIVDLSVADRRQKWDAAVVKGQTAARNLSGSTPTSSDESRALLAMDNPLVLPNSFFNTDEAIAVTRHRKAASCVAETLGRQARLGPPAGFGSPKTAWFLPGAGFTTGQDSTDVNLKAAEFFFSNHWRLYVHSTVTVEQTKDTEDTQASDSVEQIAKPDVNAISETVKSALLNPYGSPLYLTTGYLRKIRTPFFDGDANDGHHGLFLDSRVGLKFMPLPEEGLELVEGKSKNTAFYVASAALRLRLPLYKEAPFVAGEDGIDVALTGVLNRISRRSASTLFADGAGGDPLVPPTLAAANLEIGVSLPKLANVVISGTLWSNSKFDRRFQLSINLQKSDTEVPTTQTTSSEPK